MDVSHTEAAYRNLEEYITLRYMKKGDVAVVPFLSLQVLGQNIRTLSEGMKNVMTKKRHLKTLSSLEEIKKLQLESLRKTLVEISNAKIAILKASKSKSESLGEIELLKQKTLNKIMEESVQSQKYLEKKFIDSEKLVRKETKNFKEGVKQATALAIADAAAEAVGMILSVFSGGFNPAKAMKAARKVKKVKEYYQKTCKGDENHQ